MKGPTEIVWDPCSIFLCCGAAFRMESPTEEGRVSLALTAPCGPAKSWNKAFSLHGNYVISKHFHRCYIIFMMIVGEEESRRYPSHFIDGETYVNFLICLQVAHILSHTEYWCFFGSLSIYDFSIESIALLLGFILFPPSQALTFQTINSSFMLR